MASGSKYASWAFRALPEHYLIATDVAGRQEVIETNGGASMAARFFVDYDDLSSLKSEADPDYPVQVAGGAGTERRRNWRTDHAIVGL